MSERQMLVVGIRAMGLVFVFRALSEFGNALSSVALGNILSGMPLAFAGFKIVIALGLVRYAATLAIWLGEATAIADRPSSTNLGLWNRWMIAACCAFAVATIWIQSIANTARNAAMFANAEIDAYYITPTVAVFVVLESLVIPVFAIVVVQRPNWILGRIADDFR